MSRRGKGEVSGAVPFLCGTRAPGNVGVQTLQRGSQTFFLRTMS